MQRLKVQIAYDGTLFSGFQVQVNARTVQEEIEKSLMKIHQQAIRIYASGRTDSGVHAKAQVIHFDSPLDLTETNWKRALQTTLPNDISIGKVEKVSRDFHARKDARDKTYRYFIRYSKDYDVFSRNHEWHIRYPLDIEEMKKAAAQIQGTHDFTSFSASKTNVKGDKTRTIHNVDLLESDEHVVVEVTGDGFLTHMVRIIVGTLVDIGSKRKNLQCIQEAFETNDRRVLGQTAPPQGLFLWKVNY
ncbi:tRNA pseudouridine(38-40) synthase TruA [Allobacillus sp. GCM10007491]|uniref:tRNA pseudouridine synthase A n=1 Tax=Allobacillus saliphilus TaxID=2912308 RepID=A0A941CU49_9BACI|nr:tRNA pseudouridine(38-40) synthase TruA [Allobacillus saliphilus]MBR7553872.1 tRNA pseudouridine(38-40) synthase TruA [Allobacillus saliphilus]